MTNNADMPAMPVVRERDVEMFGEVPSGLTKREYAAIKIMAGFAADSTWGHTTEGTAEIAVKWADALLAELERTK